MSAQVTPVPSQVDPAWRAALVAKLWELGVRVDPGGALETVDAIELPTELWPFLDAYAHVAKRSGYLWQWVWRGLELTTLSSVEPSMREFLLSTKLLGVVLDVVLDDVADERVDRHLLEQLINIPYSRAAVDFDAVDSGDRALVEFACLLWEEVDRRARLLPRYTEFRDLLEFDYRQLLNCMRYAVLVNKNPRYMNRSEHDLYQPHNMHMMVSATLDLMASPHFDPDEVGYLREIAWNAQMMGRIGNMVSTWEREVQVGDFTSGVFAEALRVRALNVRDLDRMRGKELSQSIREAGVEASLLADWVERRDHLHCLGSLVRSFDVAAMIEGLETLIVLHLATRGRK